MIMVITRADVKHIAALARIALTAEEEDLYEKELSSVLAFVAELEKLDVRGVASMAGGADLDTIMRPDDPDLGDVLEGDSVKLLEAAPEKESGRIKVPPVF